jgi:hypothetical protein
LGKVAYSEAKSSIQLSDAPKLFLVMVAPRPMLVAQTDSLLDAAS